MNEDTRIRRLTAAAVLLVAAIAAIVSFLHIQQVALAYGQEPVAAFLLPFSIDGTVLAASLAMLRAARAGLDTPRMGRFMLVLAVLATLACNIAYGLPHGPVGALISGWPAVAFIGCAELAIGMARKLGTASVTTALDAAAAANLDPTSETAPAPAPETASETDPEPVSNPAPQIAETAAPAARPETGPRPTPTRPRGRSRTPVTERAAELEFATDLATGTAPSIRQIRKRLPVGYDRAKALRDHLEQAARDRVAA